MAYSTDFNTIHDNSVVYIVEIQKFNLRISEQKYVLEF